MINISLDRINGRYIQSSVCMSEFIDVVLWKGSVNSSQSWLGSNPGFILLVVTLTHLSSSAFVN